jgi:hypothetical protein
MRRGRRVRNHPVDLRLPVLQYFGRAFYSVHAVVEFLHNEYSGEVPLEIIAKCPVPYRSIILRDLVAYARGAAFYRDTSQSISETSQNDSLEQRMREIHNLTYSTLETSSGEVSLNLSHANNDSMEIAPNGENELGIEAIVAIDISFDINESGIDSDIAHQFAEIVTDDAVNVSALNVSEAEGEIQSDE